VANNLTPPHRKKKETADDHVKKRRGVEIITLQGKVTVGLVSSQLRGIITSCLNDGRQSSARYGRRHRDRLVRESASWSAPYTTVTWRIAGKLKLLHLPSKVTDLQASS